MSTTSLRITRRWIPFTGRVVAVLVVLGVAFGSGSTPALARTGDEPTLTLLFLDDPLPAGSEVTIRAFVVAYSPGACADDTGGSVTFRVSGYDVATVPVEDHEADLAFTFEEPGRYRVTVVYGGDTNCARSRDAGRREVV